MRASSSTLIAFSVAIALLLTSTLLLSNFLIQPAQAQTPTTFKTPKPATSSDGSYRLTFDAHGALTPNSPHYQAMNGTFQITSNQDGTIISSGDIQIGLLFSNSNGVYGLNLMANDNTILIQTLCSTAVDNGIIYNEAVNYRGPVECSPTVGGGHSASSSITGTTSTSQDSDGDGKPDSSDKCPHNSNQRCYKESM
jgi:hypothetical protein